MKIDWQFADEGEWDPYTLLGRITITGDHETCISDNCTILDRWLVGLSGGLQSLSKGISAEIDLVDEPDPLRFLATDQGYEIHYRDAILIFTDITQATRELGEEVQKFIQALRIHPEPRDETVITELSNVLSQKYE